MPEGGIPDQELFERLGVFYSEVQVAEIVKEMEDVAIVRVRGEFEMPPVDEMGLPLSPPEELLLAKQQAVRRVEGRRGMAKMLRCRVRYFTDGVVIGSKEFVNEAFANARERFGPKRKGGARAMRGSGSGAKGQLWGLRDLRMRI